MNSDANIVSNNTPGWQLVFDPDKSCCVCCQEYNLYQRTPENHGDTELSHFASLSDIEPSWWSDNNIPEGLLILSTCGEHFICIGCVRKVIHNYENHPINEHNSHFYCPYPFKECLTPAGNKNIFDHHLIKKICRTENEWNNYISYANQYAFPGMTLLRCPFLARDDNLCDTIILIDNQELRDTPVGELIIECTQSPLCNKRFCYYCRKTLNYFHNVCYDCKLGHENEIPNAYNYYLNKNKSRLLTETISDAIEDSSECATLHFEESDYLYKNGEISAEIAQEQLIALLHNVDTFMICPVCKISLYKTEKCNGLSHHGIERCYACGRIGFRSRGLGEHWNSYGIEGCFRFDHESFVKRYVQNYQCSDISCSNHDSGDCQIPEHQQGITDMLFTRHKAYIYHCLKSLSSNIKYQVYDYLHDYCYRYDLENTSKLLDLLPYKQTLTIIDVLKQRYRDYAEDIVYINIGIYHPSALHQFSDKNFTIEVNQYLQEYHIPIPEPISTDSPNLSTFSQDSLQPLLQAVEWHVTNQILINSLDNLSETNSETETVINGNNNSTTQQGDDEGDLSTRTNATEMLNRIMEEVMAEIQQEPLPAPTPRLLPPLPQLPPIPSLPPIQRPPQLPEIRYNGYTLIYESEEPPTETTDQSQNQE